MAQEAPLPLPQLPELPPDDGKGDHSGPMGLVSWMDTERLLAMLATHAAVNSRRGGGEPRRGTVDGDAEAVRKRSMGHGSRLRIYRLHPLSHAHA